MFDLILGPNTFKDLVFVLNFQTKEIGIDIIILSLRDTTKFSTRVKIERAWMANNIVMIHEPKSTLEATQQVVKILDAKYEKANLNVEVTENCNHLSIPAQEKLLKLLTKFEDLFDGAL